MKLTASAKESRFPLTYLSNRSLTPPRTIRGIPKVSSGVRPTEYRSSSRFCAATNAST
jgi:hypothetical protein